MSSERNALLQLPPTGFPIPVKVHEIFVDDSEWPAKTQHSLIGSAKISFYKNDDVRLLPFKKWVGEQGFKWQEQEIIVPLHDLIFNVAKGLEGADNPQSTEVATDKEIFRFLDTKYMSCGVDCITKGEYCIWSAENKLVFGKVVFIGAACNEDPKTKQVYVFLISDSYVDTAHKQCNYGSAVYKVELNEIFSIGEFRKLQKSVFKIVQAVRDNSVNLLQIVVVNDLAPSSQTINEDHSVSKFSSCRRQVDDSQKQNSCAHANITSQVNHLAPETSQPSSSMDDNRNTDEIRAATECLSETSDVITANSNPICNEAMDTYVPDEGNIDPCDEAKEDFNMDVDEQGDNVVPGNIVKDMELQTNVNLKKVDPNKKMPLRRDILDKKDSKKLHDKFEPMKAKPSEPSTSKTSDHQSKGKRSIAEDTGTDELVGEDVIQKDNSNTYLDAAKRKIRRYGNGLRKKQASDSTKDAGYSPIKLVGNCVAIENGTQAVSVARIKRGDTVVAKLEKEEDDVIVGEVCMTCKINYGNEQVYVGVKFERSIGLDNPTVSIAHNKNVRKDEDCKKCKQGKLVFVPLDIIGTTDEHIFNVLVADETPSEMKESATLDISVEAIRTEEFLVKPLSSLDLSMSKRKLETMGFEGRNNSCYVDSMFFTMFAFVKTFDHCLEDVQVKEKEGNPDWMRNKAIVNILKYDIINCLRKNKPVNWKSVQKLRMAFAHYNPDCNGKYMDIEEFALILFRQILHTNPFIHFDGDYQDFVYQIFVEAENVTETRLPTLQFLLDTSFKQQDVKLMAMPNPAFIVKLPVSEGNPTFPRMYPDPEITIENICNVATDTLMSLRAIICLKNSHFTCFVRVETDSSDDSEESSYLWLYHDSMPTQRRSRVVRISNFEKLYKQYKSKSESMNAPNFNDGALSEEESAWIEQILATAYMCIYVPYQNV